MSDNSQVTAHDEVHTGPIKNPRQLLLAVFFSFVIPIFIIIGLVYFVTSENKPAAGAVNMDKSVAMRIQKVGKVEIADANHEMRSGEEIFKSTCSLCHATGAAGAPKFGDNAAWAPRIKTGFDALLNSALHGKGNMPPKGGGDFDPFEVARAVVYMANNSGATFEEPKQPAAAAPAAAAPAAAGK